MTRPVASATGARRASAALVAGVLLLSGCTGASPATERLPAPSEPVVSAAQAAEIADGEVTSVEYETAYRRYLGCMSEAGHEVVETGKDRTVYEYAVADSGLDADAHCYVFEFERVDIVWQISHQDDSRSTDSLRECLHRHGVEPGATVAEIDAQMRASGISPGDCA